MKKNRFIAMMLLSLCFIIGAQAGNIVTIGIAEGAPDEEVTVSISMENTETVSALQLSIPLNDNLLFVDGSATLNNSRSNGHSVSVGVKDGSLNVMVYSFSMAALIGDEGDLLTFRLKLGNTPITIPLNAEKVVLTGTDGDTLTGSCEAGAVTIRCAKAQYSTMEIDYGAVPIHSEYTHALTVQNVGNAPLEVTALTFSDVMIFSSDAVLPMTIAPGGSQDINVKFAPEVRGSVSQTLKVACSSISKLNTIKLKAQPFAVNELHVQNASGISDETVTIHLTMNNMDGISGLQLEFDMPEQLEYLDGSFALSDRKVDHQTVVTYKERKLIILAYSPSDKIFAGEDGEIATFQITLKGRNSVNLNPAKTVLTSTYQSKVMNVCSAVYDGYVDIQSPEISAEAELKMGAQPITANAEAFFNIGNSGSAPLTINRVVFDKEGFSIKETLPLTIDSWNSISLNIIYNGTEQAEFSSIMQIYSNDPDQRLWNVNITGSRFAPNYLTMQADDIVSGDDLLVKVSLDNYDPINGIQFDVTYPSAYFESTADLSLESRATGFSMSYQQVSEGVVRCFIYSLGNQQIASGNDLVFTMKFISKPETPAGAYSLEFSNIKLGTAEMQDKYAGTDQLFVFNVKRYLAGDVNGDGVVDQVDLALMVAKLLEKNPAVFVHKNADINKDNVINQIDLALLVRILLEN